MTRLSHLLIVSLLAPYLANAQRTPDGVMYRDDPCWSRP